MSNDAIEWPCGCKVNPISALIAPWLPGQWELHYCPLHGAAEELREVLRRCVSYVSFDATQPLPLDLVDDARDVLAKAEPKPLPEATSKSLQKDDGGRYEP